MHVADTKMGTAESEYKFRVSTGRHRQATGAAGQLVQRRLVGSVGARAQDAEERAGLAFRRAADLELNPPQRPWSTKGLWRARVGGGEW